MHRIGKFLMFITALIISLLLESLIPQNMIDVISWALSYAKFIGKKRLNS